jgi:MOSC domain-containing protein YiiM
MANPTIISIQVAKPRNIVFDPLDPMRPSPDSKTWRTAIFKQPIAGPVRVGIETIEGDGQADLRYHGGPDRPMLAYCAEHYPRWAAEMGSKHAVPGGFGENLTISGMDEQTVCLGDKYSIGDVRVEVSQPRQPCAKLARRWQSPELPALVIKHNRGGWYMRTLREGMIEAGMSVELIDRPYPTWTIARAMDVYYHGKHDAAAIEALANLPPLSEQWRSHFEKLAAQF